MAFFEDLGKKISETSQGVLQKTKDSAEILKLNGMVSDEKKKVAALYNQIGEKYFELHSKDPEQAFTSLIAEVKDTQKRINDYTEQVKKLKGITKCPNCGGDVQYGSPFCSTCGKHMPESAPEAANTRFCIKCGQPINEDSAFCIHCGAKLEVQTAEEEAAPEATESNARICPNCNFEITDDSAFCIKCGTKL